MNGSMEAVDGNVKLAGWFSGAGERDKLYERFAERLIVNPDLRRSLVTYQADKTKPIYRWLKYKEAFSSPLVEYVLARLHMKPGRLLDPFAGTGTALLASGSLGWTGLGIEISPAATLAAEARIGAANVDHQELSRSISRFSSEFPQMPAAEGGLPHVPITRMAFPPQNEQAIARYREYCLGLPNHGIRVLFRFAGLCVLEDCSYTKKDGQFLRWDRRARKPGCGARFEKGPIADFSTAITEKLQQIEDDVLAMGSAANGHEVTVQEGSCLELLPLLDGDAFDVVMTSPPYCNRYDYTRTYALELVYLGLTDDDVKALRQSMLSCTVENHDKMAWLQGVYESAGRPEQLQQAIATCHGNAALKEALLALERARGANRLNNPRIVPMVRGYFLEMCVAIGEMARVVRPGGYVVMVNDNVRYAGEEIPVDLILSAFAEAFGLQAEKIWVLPRGKGNSSQQMGTHGRAELRKCVYVWRKV